MVLGFGFLDHLGGVWFWVGFGFWGFGSSNPKHPKTQNPKPKTFGWFWVLGFVHPCTPRKNGIPLPARGRHLDTSTSSSRASRKTMCPVPNRYESEAFVFLRTLGRRALFIPAMLRVSLYHTLWLLSIHMQYINENDIHTILQSGASMASSEMKFLIER